MENTDTDLVTERTKQVVESIKTYPGRDPDQPIGEDDVPLIISIVISGVLVVPLEEIAAGRSSLALLSIMAMSNALAASGKRLHSPNRN